MYSRPPSHTPKAFRKKKMFLLRLPSSTKASGHTLLISASFSTRCPACSTSRRSISEAFGAREPACRHARGRASRNPSDKARTRRSAWFATPYGLPEICRNFGRTSKPQPRYGALRARNGWNAIRSRQAQILVRRDASGNAERFQLCPAGRVLNQVVDRYSVQSLRQSKARRRQYEIQAMEFCCCSNVIHDAGNAGRRDSAKHRRAGNSCKAPPLQALRRRHVWRTEQL